MLVNFKDKDKWGYYNCETYDIIPAQFQDDSDFVDGLAIVRLYNDDHYGVIDENGNIILPFQFKSIKRLENGLFKVSMHSLLDGVIDKNGKEILPYLFSDIELQNDGLFKVEIHHLDCLYNQKNEIVDEDGVVLDSQYQKYDVVKCFGEEMYLYKQGNVQGVIFHGKSIVELQDSRFDFYEIEMHPDFFALKGGFYADCLLFNYEGKQILTDYSKFEIVSETFVIAGNDRGYGIANTKGEILFPAKYEEILHLKDQYFIYKENDNYGVIDLNGSIIIHAYYEKDIKILEDGTFSVSNWCGKKRIIDAHSHIIIQTQKGVFRLPQDLIWVNEFSEGFAIVENKERLKGAIDEHGIIVIPCKFNGELTDFHEGFSIYINRYYEKQRIDTKGEIVPEEDMSILLADNHYGLVDKLCYNRYLVQRKEDSYFAVVDKDDKVILPFCPHRYVSVKKYRDGYHSDERFFYFMYFVDSYDHLGELYDEEDNESCYFDKSGNRIIPDPLGYVIISSKYKRTRSHFSDGLAAVSTDDEHWGFVDETGKEVIPCIYDGVQEFNHGYCIVSKDGRRIVIDKSGRHVLSGYFQEIEVTEDDFLVITHSLYGHYLWGGEDKRKLNKNGEFVIPLQGDVVFIPKEYEWCDDKFHEGFLSVCKNDKWGVINTKLELVINCIYDDIVRFENGIAIAKKDDALVVLDTFRPLFWGNYREIKRYKKYNLFVCQSNQDHYDIYNGSGVMLFSSTAIKSRIKLSDTDNLSKFMYTPSEIIPIDNNYFKFEIRVRSNCSVKNDLSTKKRTTELKWGICSLNGVIIIEACFDDIGDMEKGLISVAKYTSKNSFYSTSKKMWGYADIKGNLVIDYKYAYVQRLSHDLFIARKEERGKLGLVRISDGKELTDFVYDSFSEHSSGDVLAYYQKHNEFPVRITRQGAIHYLCKCEHWRDVYLFGYDWCSDIYHGLCVVIKGRNYGIIDMSGTITFPLHDMGDIEIAPDENGFVSFKKGTEYKNVTKEGCIVTTLNGNRIELPVGVEWCGEWIDGLITIESKGKLGLLNSNLEYVLETKYHSLQHIGNKHILCCMKNGPETYFIYSIETGKLIKLSCDECPHFMNGYAIVAKHTDWNWRKEYGLIDNSGKELLPCIYSEVQFKKPVRIKKYSNHDDYEEPYDWESGYYDAFEDEPGASWGREW